MKGKILFFALLALGFIFSSCDKEDFEYEDSYQKSLKVWLNTKKQSSNSYKYTTIGGSWVGYSWETTITVYEGKVNMRSFKYTRYRDDMNPETELEWTENVLELGSHKNTPASEVLTLDEIYEKAKQAWLQKRKNTQTYFETKNDGIISLCGYRENDCADDCFIGIHISKIEKAFID